MRCIQYATGEYLIYNDIVAIALSGYRQTDHVGVDLAEDRPLSEDEVLESLLDIDGVQVEEKEHLDEYQRELLESISLHHPSFRHKVEALGFAFSHLAEARRPKNRQAKKDAKKLAQKKAGEIPPQDQGKDTAPKPREVPKGVEVDKEGKPVPVEVDTPEPPSAPATPAVPGFKKMKELPGKSFWKETIDSFLADHKYWINEKETLKRDLSKFKDFGHSTKLINEMEKSMKSGDQVGSMQKMVELMAHDPAWLEFLQIESPAGSSPVKNKQQIIKMAKHPTMAIVFKLEKLKSFLGKNYDIVSNIDDLSLQRDLGIHFFEVGLKEKMIPAICVDSDKGSGPSREVYIVFNSKNKDTILSKLQLKTGDYEEMSESPVREESPEV